MNRRTRIVCFGNPLAGDDGFGPAVHAALTAGKLPPGVAVLAAPGNGWDAIDLFADCDTAIVVDAIRGSGDPVGSLRWYEARSLPDDGRRGEHGLGLAGILRLLPGRPPAIRILGVEPAATAPFCDALSPPVAAAVPRAVATLRSLLA